MRDFLVARVCRLLVSDSEGSALIEIALDLPMAMVLVTGMFSLGVALNHYMILTNAVSAGARAFAISPAVTVTTASGTQTITDPCAYAIETANQVTPGMPTSAITYTVTYTPYTPNGPANSTTYSNGTCPNLAMNVGDTVQLNATYPYSLILYGAMPGTLNINAASSELVQ
jgi:Flp pilus assembly protein TadG